MQQVRFYAGLLIGILLVLFALQNLQPTPVRFLIWHADLPLVVTVLASAAIGALWTSLGSPWRGGAGSARDRRVRVRPLRSGAVALAA